ncbi:30S ribosomal protein S8 [Candidatus Berkelbacteria bacterium]|nr:30S ribosomal protein S8 [Candidatus Berkelbacteria bacterium]
MTDPIAQLVTSLKNAHMAGRSELRLSASHFKRDILTKLIELGYVTKFEELKEHGTLYFVVTLGGFDEIKLISKPSRRIYLKARRIPLYHAKRSKLLLSTPKGLMFDAEAKKANQGGEVILEVT